MPIKKNIHPFFEKGRKSQQQNPPEQPPKLPEKKHKIPQAQIPQRPSKYEPSQNYDSKNYDSQNYEYNEDDVDEEDYDNVVDESKEWQCPYCTYLNSLEVDVCDMCAKSRRSVQSQHSR